MSPYAAKTKVSQERSKAEIEKTLSRYGADQFMYGWDPQFAVVAFRCSGRQIKFMLPLPDPASDEAQCRPSGVIRSTAESRNWMEQETRRRWRALALIIKAKLEAVESGIVSFEEEFMAQIMLPDGQTVGQYMVPQIEQSYLSGKMPKLLPGKTG